MLARTKARATRMTRLHQGRSEAADGHTATRRTTTVAAVAHRRRQAEAAQDHALYTCQCGLVFEAPVSTTVDCPHCGDAQAW